MAKSMSENGQKNIFRTNRWAITTVIVRESNSLPGTVQGALLIGQHLQHCSPHRVPWMPSLSSVMFP